MNIIPNDKRDNSFSKSEMEMVEQEQQEYQPVGSYLRTPGLKLFGYNHIKQSLYEIEIQKGDEVHIKHINGKLQPVYNLQVEATINTSDTHFEALNERTALNRVAKFNKGIIKDLSNLKSNNPKPIY